jgi:hypothetical protein
MTFATILEPPPPDLKPRAENRSSAAEEAAVGERTADDAAVELAGLVGPAVEGVSAAEDAGARGTDLFEGTLLVEGAGHSAPSDRPRDTLLGEACLTSRAADVAPAAANAERGFADQAEARAPVVVYAPHPGGPPVWWGRDRRGRSRW